MTEGFSDLQSIIGVWLSKKEPVAATFTADANIQREEGGTFTADANIQRVEAGTFTADAYIHAIGTYLILASAVIQRTESDTFNADAVIKKIPTGTVDADATIKATTSSSFNADAVVQRTVATSIMADAHISAAYNRVEGTISARAWIVALPPPDPVSVPSVKFMINDSLAPVEGEPVGNGYWLRYPEPKKRDGNRRPVGAVGYPFIEIIFEYCTPEVFHWYNSFVSADELGVTVTSLQCWDPYKQGGADWDLFTGDGMVLWRPEVEGFRSGYYYNVRIMITGVN